MLARSLSWILTAHALLLLVVVGQRGGGGGLRMVEASEATMKRQLQQQQPLNDVENNENATASDAAATDVVDTAAEDAVKVTIAPQEPNATAPEPPNRVVQDSQQQQQPPNNATDGGGGAATTNVGNNNDRQRPNNSQQTQTQPNKKNLIWSSTGGGWRAMNADIGFANVFQQAGVMDAASMGLDSVATVSGGSWFSTQLFFSQQFYDRVVLAKSPSEIEEFVLMWMETYYNISSDVSEETQARCSDSNDINSDSYEGGGDDPSSSAYDLCILLVEYDFDWAVFIEAMLKNASAAYGDDDFTTLKASPENRHGPAASNTDLVIQAALMPNSRIRQINSTGGVSPDSPTTNVYLGYRTTDRLPESFASCSEHKSCNDLGLQGKCCPSESGSNLDCCDDEVEKRSPSGIELFTVPLSFQVVVDGDTGTSFKYGTDDIIRNANDTSSSDLNTYTLDNVPNEFKFTDWFPFYLFPGTGGQLHVDSLNVTDVYGEEGGPRPPPVQVGGPFRQPFDGPDQTTIVQAASISSAAGGPYSPLNPSMYAQTFSQGYEVIEDKSLATVWRVLAGLATGLLVGVVVGWLPLLFFCKNENGGGNTPKAKKIMAVVGVIFGILSACLMGVYVGAGSILIPEVFDKAVKTVYTDPDFDDFAVCSQWPNKPCGEQDSMIIDGWLVDNPALVANVAHHQEKWGIDNNSNNNETLKVLLTNTNQYWEGDAWVHAQITQYFSTDINEGVEPGGFMWGPGYYAPYRSPQIFKEYLSPEDLDNLIEPIENSNLTTAYLTGTTIDNPSFHVSGGQNVEILLLNTNVDITTLVVGKDKVAEYSQPLADLAKHIAGNQVLVERVREFVNA